MNGIHEIYVDTGGTFTDCICKCPGGEYKRLKVLSNSSLRGKITRVISGTEFEISTSWAFDDKLLTGFLFRIIPASYTKIKIKVYNSKSSRITIDHSLPSLPGAGQSFEITSGEEAPVLGARLLTKTPLDGVFPPMDLKLGSTKGTNALLEHKGGRTLFITTKGFADLLEIGNQSRPDIFALNVQKRSMLYSEVIEVDERIDAKGKVLLKPDLEKVRAQLNDISIETFDSVAVCLMNSYQNPAHELSIYTELISAGVPFISLSHKISPLIKVQNRADTTVVNAYLSPVINEYVNNIKKHTSGSRFYMMTSAGGLVDANHFLPKDSLLSGPAGGVSGALAIGREIDCNKLITFDMGGTSTDVSRIEGSFDYRYDLEVGDARINSPAIAIETVAAGGGSVCGFDGYKLYVGPESAGAYPGPACYGAGGPLTLTDVNLLLGRLDPSRFGIPVYPSHAEKSLEKLLNEIEHKSGKKRDADKILYGFIDIANELMAGAIRKISHALGYNPSDYTLVAFGGAGGLHACDIADMLQIKKILLPRDAGLLSAYGIGHAAIERFAVKQVLLPLDEASGKIESFFTECTKEAVKLLQLEGFSDDEITIHRQLAFMRYTGQDSCLEVNFENTQGLVHNFENTYRNTYGHSVSNRKIEIESVRVIARVEKESKIKDKEAIKTYIADPEYLTDNGNKVFSLNKLKAGAAFEGSAILLDNYASTYIKKGWQLEIDSSGTSVITRTKSKDLKKVQKTRETELELFTNRFMSIAENMGALLQRTAMSVNIKERLDFSCALLDAQGRLVANAPHIPVHLGGLGSCVRSLIDKINFEEGDTIVTNHPNYGGSHLPDVTLVTPVFYKGERIAFVVNRAHHSEIGGISPGSMPPAASGLHEEGVVISPFHLVKGGYADWEGIRKILTGYPYPTRALEENIADLNAALAANTNGKNAFLSLIKQHGRQKVTDYLDRLREYAGMKMRDTLKKFKNGEYRAKESLDDGSIICVSVYLENGSCTIDFSGSADVNNSNMNATEAIVRSVTIYVLRLLLNESIPLNDGLMEHVKLILPHGMLNPVFHDDPARCPAIVGGNVEISQRLTDTLLKAFNVVAASQGTMNNLIFGNKDFGYYETICGGCGAGEDFNGADAVHHHMTNTRITDAEIIEHRYPVRLEEFSVRKSSGGKGKNKGGNGVIRHITFLEAVNLSVLTQRRKSGPYGINGGLEGKPGSQEITRKNGEIITLGSVHNIDLKAGDSLVMKTPGGGGYGIPT